MAATPTRPGSKAAAGDSKAQHALILAVCSPIAGITDSARPYAAQGTRLDAETGLNDGLVVKNLRGGVSNRKCRLGKTNPDEAFR
jgi:hypothetical protein